MKKLLFLLITIALFSCSKKATEVKEVDFLSQLSLQTKAVLAQKDLTSMKQSYSMLSDIEQELLWKAKLNHILKYDDLTVDQRAVIDKMLMFLSETSISKMKMDNSLPDDFVKQNAKSFLQNFTPEQLFFIIEHPFVKAGFTLKHAKEYLSIIPFQKSKIESKSGIRLAATCACRYDIGCGFGNSCNTSSGCSGGKDCGLFGTSTCKGNCEQGNGGPVMLE